jgi:malate dehydrogenase (oxaloacetate-decarboxylating)(NADP+)
LQRPLTDQRVLFVGAGEAGSGIAEALTAALMREGLNEEEARGRCWMVDSKGLIVTSRDDLEAHKRPFAKEHAPSTNLEETVAAIKPTAIIGTTAHAGMFTEPIVRTMAANCERPIIFALSNPTSKAECTAEQAYRWTEGRALFASGSPFQPVELGGRTHVPGQGNNAYIFPGIGLGAILCAARRVTDDMFMAAADTLAAMVDEESLASGCLYPPLSKMHDISAAIAVAVIRCAQQNGNARKQLPDDLDEYVRSMMYVPEYPDYTG